MSVVYQQIKMKLTTVSVNYMRQFCDGCNILIHVTLSPFRRITNRLSAEAPWLVTLLACTTVSIFPLLAYPYMKHYFFDDKRTKLEIERVRLCIQKGIDPYPFMHNKDLVLGNIGATLRKDSEMPEDMAWEHTLLHDYQKRKEELRREVGGNVDDTVEKLLRLREQHNAKMRSQTLDSIIKTTSDTTFAKRSPKRDETAV